MIGIRRAFTSLPDELGLLLRNASRTLPPNRLPVSRFSTLTRSASFRIGRIDALELIGPALGPRARLFTGLRRVSTTATEAGQSQSNEAKDGNLERPKVDRKTVLGEARIIGSCLALSRLKRTNERTNPMSLLSRLARLAAPISGAYLISMASQFTSMFYLGHLGATELAAAALGIM
jgi:hypothetical protein